MEFSESFNVNLVEESDDGKIDCGGDALPSFIVDQVAVTKKQLDDSFLIKTKCLASSQPSYAQDQRIIARIPLAKIPSEEKQIAQQWLRIALMTTFGICLATILMQLLLFHVEDKRNQILEKQNQDFKLQLTQQGIQLEEANVKLQSISNQGYFQFSEADKDFPKYGLKEFVINIFNPFGWSRNITYFI